MALIGSALVVLAAMTLWSWFRQWRTTEYVLLVGPGGSISADDARRIKSRVERASSIWNTYRVRMEETEGFEEIRRLINADASGRMIGFAHDGFGNAENVRILLPLDKNYLHILCRRGFLESLVASTSPGESSATIPLANGPGELGDRPSLPDKVTFADLAAERRFLEPGRFALGPLNSGTRQLAELVMQRYDLDPDKYQTNGIVNWHDMRAALNNAAVDVAFYGGRMDSEIMRNIAADRSSVLIGLDEDRDAIIQGHLHLLPEQFEKNSYSNGGFCPTALQTFASRRVLLCSSSMSDSTAYFLTKHARDAMRPIVPEIDWANPPPNSPRAVGLTYQIHPGAERFRNNSPLGTGPWNSNYVLMTLALWLATELVQAANRRFRKTKPAEEEAAGAQAAGPAEASEPPGIVVASPALDPAAADAASREVYDSLECEIHEDVSELIGLPELSKAERAQWLQKVQARRRRVEQLRAEGRLREKHSAALVTAVDKLASALERRNGKPRKKDPWRRAALR
jgi:hypothetical protein